MNLSAALQSVDCDLIATAEMIKVVKNEYESHRTNAEGVFTFSTVFAEAKKFADDHDIPVTFPTTGRTLAAEPEDHYRTRVFIPLLDAMIEQMNTRFGPAFEKAAQGYCIIPAFMDDHKDTAALAPFLELYSAELPPSSLMRTELSRWEKKWEGISPNERPNVHMFFLGLCCSLLYNIIMLCQQEMHFVWISCACVARKAKFNEVERSGVEVTVCCRVVFVQNYCIYSPATDKISTKKNQKITRVPPYVFFL